MSLKGNNSWYRQVHNIIIEIFLVELITSLYTDLVEWAKVEIFHIGNCTVNTVTFVSRQPVLIGYISQNNIKLRTVLRYSGKLRFRPICHINSYPIRTSNNYCCFGQFSQKLSGPIVNIDHIHLCHIIQWFLSINP